MKLKDKWVLITGASSGFGAAAARSFAAEGTRLLIGARRLDRLAKIQTNAIGLGAPEAHYHPLDVSKTSSVNDFMNWAGEKIRAQNPKGKLDVLINNAGGALGLDPVAEGKDEDWETMMQTNVLGVLRMIRASLPLMLNNPGSSILNVGSFASYAV